MSLALIPGIGSLGGTELIIALVIILLLFGAKKIPELARGLGSGVREFKAGTKEGQIEDKKDEKKKEEELKAGEGEKTVASEGTDTSVREDPPVEADKAEQQSR